MDPAQLFERQEIFYFHLSTTLGHGSSAEIARLAMFMLLTTATLTPQRPQVYLMIDEFQRVAAHNVDAILQIARSMNVGVILANQSMLDLKQENLIHVVEANCRYRQWYAISSPEEQERLSKGSGETVDLMHSATVSTQRDGFETRTTVSHSSNQFIAPRLSTNDIKLASDDPDPTRLESTDRSRPPTDRAPRGQQADSDGGMDAGSAADWTGTNVYLETRR